MNENRTPYEEGQCDRKVGRAPIVKYPKWSEDELAEYRAGYDGEPQVGSTEQEHTPLPWIVSCGEYPKGMGANSIVIHGFSRKRRERCICRIWMPEALHSKANARYIVKAVNCHDELVAAIRWLTGDYVCKGHDNDSECPHCNARDILAKAEKRCT